MEENQGMELSLQNIWDLIKRGIWIIVAAAIVFGGAAFAWSKYMIEPTYQCKVKLAANSMDTDSQLINFYITIAPQYIEFLNVGEFYQMVADEVLSENDVLFNSVEIGNMLSFSSVVENTGVFFVTVSGHSPEEVYNVASAVAKCAPELIKNQKASDVLSVISLPTMPKKPSSPNIPRNTAIAAVAGAVIAAAIIVARDLFDTTLKSPNEITERYGLSVLGIVPDFSETSNPKDDKKKNGKETKKEK